MKNRGRVVQTDYPRLLVDQKEEFPLFYYFPNDSDDWQPIVQQMIQTGVRMVTFPCPGYIVNPAWPAPGRFDFAPLDTQIDRILRWAPSVRLLPRVNLNPPAWWIAAHPADVLTEATMPEVLPESDWWQGPAWEYLERLLAHWQAAGYLRHIIGIHVEGGCEWFDPRWRQLKAVDWATARTRSEQIKTHFLRACRLVKDFSEGALLAGGFYGYLTTRVPATIIAHLHLHEVLHSQAVDFLSSPHEYQHRGIHGASEAQTLVDAVLSHGKLFVYELDDRLYHQPSSSIDESIRSGSTFAESSRILRRHANYIRSHPGMGLWWMDLFGNLDCGNPDFRGFFTPPPVLKLVGWLNRDLRMATDFPRPEVVVILDENSPGDADLVSNAAGDWLNRLGCPVAYHLKEEITEPDFPTFRAYLFLDCSEAPAPGPTLRISRAGPSLEEVSRFCRAAGVGMTHPCGSLYYDSDETAHDDSANDQ